MRGRCQQLPLLTQLVHRIADASALTASLSDFSHWKRIAPLSSRRPIGIPDRDDMFS